MKSTIPSWKKLWQDLGTRRWIILLFVGILLVVVAIPVGDREESRQQGSITGGQGSSESGIDQEIDGEWKEGSGAGIRGDDVSAAVSRYEADLERRLTSLLQQIEGAGAVQVMVTVHRSKELILQMDTSREETVVKETDAQGGTRDNVDQREEKETVLIGAGGTSQPYVVGEIMPQIEGVVVACEGGDRPVIQAEISAAVQALFDLAPHKIKVCKMASP